MGRSLNRKPLYVDTSIKGLNTEVFNHFNWKGICTDKNIPNLDPETFEDCKNVYIDEHGVLSSRPTLQNSNIKSESKILNSWTFENVLVLYLLNSNVYKLVFIENDTDVEFNVEVDIVPKLMYFDGKIVIFTGKNIKYYKDGSINDGDSLIYKPVKYLYTNNVSTLNESDNVLTTSYVNRYIYHDVGKIVSPPYVGKTVRLRYGNVDITKTFSEGYENVIFLEKFNISENNLYDYDMNHDVLVDISNGGVILTYEDVGKEIVDESGHDFPIAVSPTNFIINYAVSDDTILKQLPNANLEIYGKPMISDDGTYAVVITKNGPYVSSLTDSLNFPRTWYDLLFYNTMENAVKNLDEAYKLKPYNSPTFGKIYQKCIAGKFVDVNNFVYVYAVLLGNLYTAGIVDYNCYVVVQCINGKVKVRTVTDSYYYTNCVAKVGDNYYNFVNNDIKVDFDESGVVIMANAYNIDKATKYSDGYHITEYVDRDAMDIHGDCECLYIEYYKIDTDESYKTIIPYSELTLNIVSDNIDVQLFSDRIRFAYAYIWNYNKPVSMDIMVGYIDLKQQLIYYDADVLGTVPLFMSNGDLVTDLAYYKYNNYNMKVRHNYKPVVKSKERLYVVNGKTLYSNYIGPNDIVTVDVINSGKVNNEFIYEHYCELNDIYLSKYKNLYISSYVVDGEDKLLYFPTEKIQKFDKKITNVHPISETQVAIFFDDEIWHTDLTDDYKYLYYKSKLQTGLLEGSDVITSVDGKNIIFSSTRGLVYLSYQELVQSTEQTLTYLSDTVNELYDDYNKRPIKLYLDKYWLYCYNDENKSFFIFDLRNSSWWKWEYNHPILNILSIEKDLYFITNADKNNCKKLEKYPELYLDDVDTSTYTGNEIEWYFTSQKLHFNTLNYYKNIHSIIVNSLESQEEPISYNLSITNYRVATSERYLEPENILYKVNTLRTYVKRCNSRKVNSFQYTISSDTGDNGNAIQSPFNIHSIMIKYNISGEVR